MHKNLKIPVAIGVVAILTNPLVSQYLIKGFESLMFQAVVLSPYFAVIFTLYVVFLLGYYYALKEKINIPDKDSKTEKQEYIKT